MCVCGGGGVLVQKFLRYKVDGSYVVITKLFLINKNLVKELWHSNSNPGSNM